MANNTNKDKFEEDKQLLTELIEEGKQFTLLNPVRFKYFPGIGGVKKQAAWTEWRTRCRNIIRRLCAHESSQLTQLQQADVKSSSLFTITPFATLDYIKSTFDEVQDYYLNALKSTIDALINDKHGELLANQPQAAAFPCHDPKKIFVVHGHDNELKLEVEQFLNEIGLQPIILHRKPDEGKTLIEKFEKHSDVGFAFVLLTPDDIVCPADQAGQDDGKQETEHRARQNVIFEFGFFVGKIGRDRVCCLYKEGVTVPSDLNGLLYKKLSPDVNSVTFPIIKELQAAGYEVKLPGKSNS